MRGERMLQQSTGLQLRSTVKKEGILELSLTSVPIPEPRADEVVVRVDASPVNPSDLGLMFGGADMSTAKVSGALDNPIVTANIPPSMMKSMIGRMDQSLPVGNDWSMRPIMDFIIDGGMFAVTIGLSRAPETFAVDMSAPPNISPRSEGLTGDASTRTTTSSALGSGIGTLVSESSRMPSFLTVDRNWSPVDCC